MVITAVVTVGLWLADRTAKSVPPSGTITSVQDNLVLTRDALYVAGEASDIPAGSEVWIVVRAGVERLWYPVKAVNVASDGTWRSDEDPNNPQEVLVTTPGAYYIQIYCADMGAIAALQKEKADSLASGIYDGMQRLPRGARFLDEKPIRRTAPEAPAGDS
ncbi:hypothetical protein [Spongiactinospora sp. TRM90649]|uniref:hypothetical protein n=1 Tax=Spongiactinospora sp. TRM90649 TaxID=3031114 RepID=UPI0023F858F7|nr:hypothetical protein [Spongiactinospora sp. TRM90649]MDF5758360.1 hypothetical protein [Spongiactinospora sp. TRM90649]